MQLFKGEFRETLNERQRHDDLVRVVMSAPSEGIDPGVLAAERVLFIVHAYSFVSSGATEVDLVTLIIILRRDKWYLAKKHFSC
jgi:hypothetical protein